MLKIATEPKDKVPKSWYLGPICRETPNKTQAIVALSDKKSHPALWLLFSPTEYHSALYPLSAPLWKKVLGRPCCVYAASICVLLVSSAKRASFFVADDYASALASPRLSLTTVLEWPRMLRRGFGGLTFDFQAVEDVCGHCIDLQLTGALLHLIQD